MDLDNLTYKEIKELQFLFAKPKSEPKEIDGGIRIVILQRGWVAVGHYHQKGSECRLENASVIRKWGTTKGLGEIAQNGPTSETILDATPTIRFHALTVIATLDCEQSKWK